MPQNFKPCFVHQWLSSVVDLVCIAYCMESNQLQNMAKGSSDLLKDLIISDHRNDCMESNKLQHLVKRSSDMFQDLNINDHGDDGMKSNQLQNMENHSSDLLQDQNIRDDSDDWIENYVQSVAKRTAAVDAAYAQEKKISLPDDQTESHYLEFMRQRVALFIEMGISPRLWHEFEPLNEECYHDPERCREQKRRCMDTTRICFLEEVEDMDLLDVEEMDEELKEELLHAEEEAEMLWRSK